MQGQIKSSYDDVLNISSPSRYELSWYLPEDNGEPIDFFEISFFPVKNDPYSDTLEWQRVGNVFRTEVPHPGNVRLVDFFSQSRYSESEISLPSFQILHASC